MDYLHAKRYTDALIAYADEQGKLDAVTKDLGMILGVIEHVGPFNSFLKDPCVASSDRIKIIEKTLKGKCHSITYHFLLFLEKKSRIFLLEDICLSFLETYRKMKGILQAKVVTAHALSEKQLSLIADRLATKSNPEVQLTQATDPSLLGGFKVQIEDTVYDHSIKTKLQKFKEHLIHA